MLLLGMQCEPLSRSHRTEGLAHHWVCGMNLCGLSGNVLGSYACEQSSTLRSATEEVRVRHGCPHQSSVHHESAKAMLMWYRKWRAGVMRGATESIHNPIKVMFLCVLCKQF